MIDIKIYKKIIDNIEYLSKIIVKGHSGFGTKGNDIICSSISFLVQSYSFFIYKTYGTNIELRNPKEALIELDLNKLNYNNLLYKDEKLKYLNDFLINSLILIENNFKDYIKLEIYKDNFIE
ncbi:MAG: ribosomal-processing cysteine protease Prp [Spirochaetes bacterium]|nr:ribosomal-processing cysteine protease Prp [Spirochaetota bacterium]